MQQLPLNIELKQHASFDNFVVGGNVELLQRLRQLSANTGFDTGAVSTKASQLLYIHGEQGSGCSHLLYACAAQAQQQGLRIAIVPLAHSDLRPDCLEGLEQCDVIVLDDVDAVSDQIPWCDALFGLFNAARDARQHLLLSAKLPPAQIECVLPDLQSRLSGALIFGLSELSDNDKQQLLQSRAHELGMRLPDDVAQFLLTRSSRSLNVLLDSLAQLDRASLAEQRRLTIPFVKQTLRL